MQKTTSVVQPKEEQHGATATTTQRIIRLITFLVAQFAILFITGMLYTTLTEMGFYLSVFLCLEFLLAVVLFFFPRSTEQELAKTCRELGSLIVYGNSTTHHQLGVILSLLKDVQQVQETTDSRLAVVEEKLPQVGLVKRIVDGTSQPLPSVNPPTSSGRKRATTTKAKAATPGTD